MVNPKKKSKPAVARRPDASAGPQGARAVEDARGGTPEFLEHRAAVGILISIVALAFLPGAALKALAMVAGLWLFVGGGRLSRAQMRVILFTVFGVSFLVSPYWKIPANNSVQISLLLLLVAVGAAWA